MFPFDPRNPYPMGYQPLTPEQAAMPAPTPAAAAAKLGTPGYPQQSLANPGIYAPQSRANIPPSMYKGGESPQQAQAGAAFGLGPTTTPDPMAMQFDMMRSGSLPTAPAGPAAPRAPRAPRNPAVSGSARTAPLARGGGDTGPAAGAPEPATPDGQQGPTLTAPPPAVGAAAAMDAGDPDKQDFLDMQGAIANWQMGMGGTGQRLTDANRLQETGADIDTRAQIKGRHPVNQLTRALGGIGSGYAIQKSNKERALIKETADQLRSTARAELERIREKRRGGKKPESALDKAFAQSGDVSAALKEDEFPDYIA